MFTLGTLRNFFCTTSQRKIDSCSHCSGAIFGTEWRKNLVRYNSVNIGGVHTIPDSEMERCRKFTG